MEIEKKNILSKARLKQNNRRYNGKTEMKIICEKKIESKCMGRCKTLKR